MLIAGAAHDGQRRKYSGLPYIVHPVSVAMLCTSELATDYTTHTTRYTQECVVAIALLHDTVEDCDWISIADLHELIGDILVSEGVQWLTNPPLRAGNRAHRHAIVCQKMSQAPWPVRLVKAYDRLDNLSEVDTDFLIYNRFYLDVYLEESRTLCKALQEAPADNKSAWPVALHRAIQKLSERLEVISLHEAEARTILNHS